MSLDIAVESEACAWKWLLDLQRFDWKDVKNPRGAHGEAQVRVTMMPGALDANLGCPYIVLLVSHPSVPDKRFRASGNTLSVAVSMMHKELWAAGVELPFTYIRVNR